MPKVRPGLGFSALQSADRRAEVRVRVVVKLDDERMAVERRLNDAALNAAAASVDQSQLAQSRRVCRVDVFIDDRGDIRRLEHVEIELGLDRNPVDVAGVVSHASISPPDVRQRRWS